MEGVQRTVENPKSDVVVLLITFFLTVIFDLTVAIEVGLVIACVLFMKRVMETTKISVITDEIDPNNESDLEVHEEHLVIPQGVEVYEINGPYFFGIATKFEEIMSRLGDRPKSASSVCEKFLSLILQVSITSRPYVRCHRKKIFTSSCRVSTRKYTKCWRNPGSMNCLEKKTSVATSMKH